MQREMRLAEAMLGQSRASVLMTDAYKFSMAQAGFPLRSETFYLGFRKQGWYYVPFDLSTLVNALCPALPTQSEQEFLHAHGYGLTDAMERALQAKPSVWAAPKGSWVREHEPFLSISAPSFLASWLEPLVIWLHYPIQVATAALAGQRRFECSCEAEAEISTLTLEAIDLDKECVVECKSEYSRRVRSNAQALVESVKGDVERLFEVGMRSATCMQMHLNALQEVLKSGVKKTSNVHAAFALGLQPVGTTGHEHQQRWGDDINGFRAIRDMRPALPSYLFDTYDALQLGIPAAIQAMRECPERPASVRFDSGDHETQLHAFLAAGTTPTFIFMDSMSPLAISKLERVCSDLAIPAQRRLYGVGGYFVSNVAPGALTRNRVAAVYKLSMSGERATMKFSVPSKTSVPGRPVILRRKRGPQMASKSGRSPQTIGLIGQEGEVPPQGYEPLQPGPCPGSSSRPRDLSPIMWSPGTRQLVRTLAATNLVSERNAS
jgi:nicotinic acid phosphoribosyltransferase